MELLDKNGYVSYQSFVFLEKKIKSNSKKTDGYLSTIADLIRYNTLLSVARAGTGHIGASLSIIELLAEIYFRSFKFSPDNLKAKDRDIFILSKGHAAPSLYATLAAKGYIRTEELDRLRRLNGLEGHCDISTRGIEANTGSLGIGLSKAVGFAIAKKRFGLKGAVVVIIGNGELQEGQCWEAFLSAASYGCDNLYILIDDNKVQTDQYTRNIVKYGDFVKSFRSLGFAVIEDKGESVKTIHKVFTKLKKISAKPKLFYSHTIKGQGVSYMEHRTVSKKNNDCYIWHNKAPNLPQLNEALLEIFCRVSKTLKNLGFIWNLKNALKDIPKELVQTNIKGKSLLLGFSEGLLRAAKKYKNIVVFDADLEEDCGYRKFHQTFPEHFFEMGIMEQHLVSASSAFSRLGYISVISTYAAFLTSRANEQLYNLASEVGNALIVGNMAGVIPATPGKSHQAFRDIACMKNIPNLTMYQPVSSDDTRNILERYFRGELDNILYLRLSMAPSAIELPTPNKELKKGLPQILRKGKDALLIGIGPVVLGECMLAAEELRDRGIEVEIWNYPWLIDFDREQILKASIRDIPLIIIEDHFVKGGFGESLLAYIANIGATFKKVIHISLRYFPKTGFRDEALKYFGLHKENITKAVFSLFP